jgi:hypothetical protein
MTLQSQDERFDAQSERPAREKWIIQHGPDASIYLRIFAVYVFSSLRDPRLSVFHVSSSDVARRGRRQRQLFSTHVRRKRPTSSRCSIQVVQVRSRALHLQVEYIP